MIFTLYILCTQEIVTDIQHHLRATVQEIVIENLEKTELEEHMTVVSDNSKSQKPTVEVVEKSNCGIGLFSLFKKKKLLPSQLRHKEAEGTGHEGIKKAQNITKVSLRSCAYL